MRLAVALAAAALVPANALADALQQQVLAVAQAVKPTDFAFTQSMRSERTGAAPRDDVLRYDPRRGTNAWALIKVDGKPPTAKQSAGAAKSFAKIDVPSYSRITEWFGAPATRTASTGASVTYHFAALPKGTIKIGSSDVSATTKAEAVVNTAGGEPFVEHVRFTSSTPFRMFLVVKVDRFVIDAFYRLTSKGKPAPAQTVAEFSGSFLGKAQMLKTHTTYGDIEQLR